MAAGWWLILNKVIPKMRKFIFASLLLASQMKIAHASNWIVLPYKDSMSNVSSVQIQSRSTNDVAAYVLSCSNPKFGSVTITDVIVIGTAQVTSDIIDVRLGVEDKPFIFSSSWKVQTDVSGSSLTPPDGLHLHDFMLDGGVLEVGYTTMNGPEIIKFKLIDFADSYRQLMHYCK